MKLGRNQLCPCQSGKKFKHCCLKTAGRRVVAGSADVDDVLRTLVRENQPTLISAMQAPGRLAISRVRRKSEWSDAKRDSDRLTLAMQSLKAVAGEIMQAQPHSLHYCFQLYRRLVPIIARTLGFTWLGISAADNEHLRSGETVGELIKLTSQLVVRTADLSSHQDATEWKVTEALRGIDYSGLSIAEIECGAKLISLALLWDDCRRKSRYANKGFTVFASDGLPTNLAKENTESVTDYETRRDKYDTMTGTAGFWHDSEVTRPLRPDYCGWFGAYSVRRFAKRDTLTFAAGKDVFPIDFLWLPLSDSRLGATCRPPTGIQDALLRTIPYDRLIDRGEPWYELTLGETAGAVISYLYALYRLLRLELGFSTLTLPKPAT